MIESLVNPARGLVRRAISSAARKGGLDSRSIWFPKIPERETSGAIETAVKCWYSPETDDSYSGLASSRYVREDGTSSESGEVGRSILAAAEAGKT
jgi:hypothetical protein